MIVAFVIWSVVAMVFVGIGVSCRKSKEPVGFFTGVKPPAVKDVKQYNKAVSRLWIVFAVLLEMLGVPFLFAYQNSPVFIIVMLGVMVLVIALMVAYLKIEAKYRY